MQTHPIARELENRSLKLAPLAGVVGPVLFAVIFSIAGFVREDYSALEDAISDLGVGENAWLQNLNFVIFGLLLVVFGVGYFRVMQHVTGRQPALIGMVLIVLSGLGAIGSAVFTAAPETEILHFLAGFLPVFASAFATIGYTGWRLRGVPNWEAISRYSFATLAGAFGLFALSFIALNPASPLEDAGIGGLIERLFFVEVFAWHVVMGFRLYRESASR